MSEPEIHHLLLMAMFVLSGVTFAVLGLTSAPYGRHARRGWGPGVPERLAWVLMELPGAVVSLSEQIEAATGVDILKSMRDETSEAIEGAVGPSELPPPPAAPES